MLSMGGCSSPPHGVAPSARRAHSFIMCAFVSKQFAARRTRIRILHGVRIEARSRQASLVLPPKNRSTRCLFLVATSLARHNNFILLAVNNNATSVHFWRDSSSVTVDLLCASAEAAIRDKVSLKKFCTCRWYVMQRQCIYLVEFCFGNRAWAIW